MCGRVEKPEAPEGAQTCRECGCWDFEACLDGDGDPCFWVEKDLCSHCEDEERWDKWLKEGKKEE